MNRLHAEWRRLFAVDPAPDAWPAPLLDAQGARTRTLVIGWGRPADWPTLRALWQAAQVELGWPAPLIAIDGHAAFQLWISLAEPVPAAQAHEVAAALARRWLPATSEAARAARLEVWPRPDPQAGPWRHAAPVPALQADPQPRWSAFVAPDLAAVFGDEPALDIDPGDEAQADLLARGGSVGAPAWARACDLLRQAGAGPKTASTDAAAGPTAGAGPDRVVPEAALAPTAPMPPDLGGPHDDPAAFLMAVMNHPAVPLALRIEAARALLPQPGPARPGR